MRGPCTVSKAPESTLSSLRAHAPRPSVCALAWAALVASALCAPLRQANAAACSLQRLHVSADTGAQRVTLHTNCSPRYSVLRLHGPERIVLDLADTGAESAYGQMAVQRGVVAGIDIRAFEGPTGPIGRIVVATRGEQAFDVQREGQDVVLALPAGKVVPTPPASDPIQPPAAPGASAAAGAAAQGAVPAAPPAQPAPALDPTEVPIASPLTPAEHSAAAEAVPQPGRLTAVRRRGGVVFLQVQGSARHEAQRLAHPSRYFVDLLDAVPDGVANSLVKRPTWLKRVRTAKRGAGSRVVFDLVHAPALAVVHVEGGLLVGPAHAKEMRAARSRAPRAHGGVHVTTLHFDEVDTPRGTTARIFVHTGGGTAEPQVDTRNPRAFVLALPNVRLPSKLERGLDTRASHGPVSMVSSFQAEHAPPSTHIVVSLKSDATQWVQPLEGGFCWHIYGGQAHASQSAVRTQVRTAGYMHESIAQPEAHAGLGGKRISLDVKDADIANVLRLISEETGENIIASDEVHGKVTLKLRNVPAEQALDTILRVKGFDKVRSNNILRIATAETIQRERDAEVARKRALIEVEEVVIRMVTVNYATASEVVDQLKPMLSGRGSVQVDGRTNTLIMQDIASNMNNLVDLARRLDKQTPLVNIQARIVEADSTFVRDMGVQWGGVTKHTALSGNPTGLYFPADVTAQGAADVVGAAAGGAAGAASTNVASPSRYAVNLPASLTGSGTALGFIMGSAGGSQLLDLRLSAMETSGNGKVISSPEVSTLDNRTARVSQGISFAVSTVSAAGTNVKFVPAVLELEVTPHVTNDGTVLLKLHVQKSAPDFTNRSGNGDPSIQSKEAQTEVLVRDGDTSVIGGILTRNTSESRNQVPFLAKIPLIGYLFREQYASDSRSELLVFITPRIINRDESKIIPDNSMHTGGFINRFEPKAASPKTAAPDSAFGAKAAKDADAISEAFAK